MKKEMMLTMDPVEVYKMVLNKTIGKFPNGFFRRSEEEVRNSSIKILKYLIEDVLKCKDDEVCNVISHKILLQEGLAGMILRVFNCSIYEAINAVYPNRFKPWQFASVYKKYWNKETAIEATKWLIEDKLKWDEEQICQNLSVNTFVENGLSGMLVSIFGGSTYEALNSVYPNKFKPWCLKYVPRNYWNKETAREATKWLIEDKLKWDEEEVCQKLTQKVFKENGLSGMINGNMFSGSTYRALENAYPGKYIKINRRIKLNMK